MAKPDFQEATRVFAEALRRGLTSVISVQPEDQLKGPTQTLVQAAGQSRALKIETYTEIRVEGLMGRPDIGVLATGLLCGHIELKAPGKGARVERLKGADKQQWDKFRALPNVLYTDGCEWALYRDGNRFGKVAELGDDLPSVGASGLQADGIEALEDLLQEFLRWTPVVPASPKGLAQMLAPLCGLLRDDVLDALEKSDSAVSQIATEWREALFPEADQRQFADAYAQTLTYALLLARFEGQGLIDTNSAQEVLQQKHGLLARSLRILSDPQVREEIGLGISLLERSINAIDLSALRKRTTDPWLYFYEDFLAAYDPKLRNDRGVYYTPVQVIAAQCRLVEQLLRERFDRKLGFADKGVVLLDPGAGTGAYLLAAIEMGLDRVTDQQGPGAVSGWASVLAENVHGFEILVGPYAVAHLRLTQAVLAAGGELPADGAHIYLTDTLESPHAQVLSTLSIFHKPLADEHKRARRVKAETRVLVCLGNPPYNRQEIDPEDTTTERKGGWVRHGEHGADAPLNDFLRPAKESGQGIHLKNLYNDYVYFWRWALWKVFEEKKEPIQAADAGIVSFITAASYLRGPGFVGMRKVMRETFDELWIVDLEGGLGARKTENVFAIRTPVAIAVGVRYGLPHPETPAKVHYARLEGTRSAKLEQLGGIERFEDLKWRDCFEDWVKPFHPRSQQSEGYFSWPAVSDLFPWQHAGIQIKRTWPIGETKDVLVRRWKALLARIDADRRSLPLAEGSAADAFHQTRDRRIGSTYEPLPGQARQPPLNTLKLEGDTPPLVRFAHRSLDRKWMLADARLGDFLRPALWASYSDRQVFLTSLLTEVLGAGPAAVACSHVPDLHHFRGSFGGKDVIPLWRDPEGKVPNVTVGLLDLLSRHFGVPVGAEDLFGYVYAILASPAYVDQFWEELTLPGPRIPLTKDHKVFDDTVASGKRLICLHTFGQRFESSKPAALEGSVRCTKAIPSRPEAYPDKFDYDPIKHVLLVGQGEFEPVPQAVWDFSVSGLDVVKSWLGYRMKEPAGRSSSPLDEIRPERWTAEMTEELLELLWTIEATLALFPNLAQNLDRLVTGPSFRSEELPQPAEAERMAPAGPAQSSLPHI